MTQIEHEITVDVLYPGDEEVITHEWKYEVSDGEYISVCVLDDDEIALRTRRFVGEGPLRGRFVDYVDEKGRQWEYDHDVPILTPGQARALHTMIGYALEEQAKQD